VDSQPKSSGLVLGRRPLSAVLHSLNEPGELSQWLCHDDSTLSWILLLLYFSSHASLLVYLITYAFGLLCFICCFLVKLYILFNRVI